MWLRCNGWVAALLVGAATAASGQAAPTGPDLIVVVRHAEKASETARDPDLSATGQARAAALDSALAGLEVTTVIGTPFVRTCQTAAVVARRHRLECIEVAIGSGGIPAHAAQVAAEARRHPGAVLIVGHSNTVGAVVAALGGQPNVGDLADSDYQSIFMVLPQETGVGTLRTRFGAP